MTVIKRDNVSVIADDFEEVRQTASVISNIKP